MTHRIGCKLQAGTDFRKFLRFLENLNAPAARRQFQRRA